MSDSRLVVRSYAVTHPPNLDLPTRRYEAWDQLCFASQGVMNVETSDGTWVVPPHRAVWIPAGTQHAVRMTGRVSLRTLFFAERITRRRLPRACRAVNVSPLLRELVLHVCRIGILHASVAEEVRLARVVLDQLVLLEAVPLQLPLPADPRARVAAEHLAAEPGAPGAIERAARASRASRRTLERLFAAETNMTLGRYHQRARIIAALRLLAGGAAVTHVALEVGYATPSAFIAAFKAELGTTPGRYFAQPGRRG
ncbi:MAG: helix-turn-helix transcriptional regulator [Deltaproteobacteria bacterium]|nr:helix-turn-helix transcriptional regulator [Deltaproteobacteria bacterium]